MRIHILCLTLILGIGSPAAAMQQVAQPAASNIMQRAYPTSFARPIVYCGVAAGLTWLMYKVSTIVIRQLKAQKAQEIRDSFAELQRMMDRLVPQRDAWIASHCDRFAEDASDADLAFSHIVFTRITKFINFNKDLFSVVRGWEGQSLTDLNAVIFVCTTYALLMRKIEVLFHTDKLDPNYTACKQDLLELWNPVQEILEEFERQQNEALRRRLAGVR